MLYFRAYEERKFVPDEDCPKLDYISADIAYTLKKTAVT